MRIIKNIILFFIISLCCFSQDCNYCWKKEYNKLFSVTNLIKVPIGYERVKVDSSSFQYWLRNLPIKIHQKFVYLYNGEKKFNQNAQYAIIDIDVGEKNLQQCADAVIRLRAEYLFSQKKFEVLHFNFTSGDRIDYKKWADGYRVNVNKNKVSWQKKTNKNYSYKAFRSYLDIIFTYAGSYSLKQELKKVSDKNNIQIGDVFIVGGFPGHAVIVIDVAYKKNTREKIFLIAQSYMPAQDIHILKNWEDNVISPWYKLDTKELYTPEWTFSWNDLYRFE
ncbi:MAG: DUF4846 domain-containing protein [Ignavibacteriales bacterium]|nr:DUF4846 domain-containing protein [Ignavibacteriales bacterium]